MCVGVPMQVVSVDGFMAVAQDGDHLHTVDVSLIGTVEPGTWVLNFLGAAREVLDPDEAQKIKKALGGLAALMQGGDLGDAFADLEARAPQLPPHLQAALDKGETTA